MPDNRKNRGAHPEDQELFAHRNNMDLKAAVADMSMLLTRGYSQKGTLKLVGDRYKLTDRQRLAVYRSACSDQQLFRRNQGKIREHQLVGEPVIIDGFNLLITVEAAMSGGFIFIGKDGCFRDIASVHGSYRSVEQTIPALKLIGKTLAELKPGKVLWVFDSPVSNSGKLKILIEQLGEKSGFNWKAVTVESPDKILSQIDDIVISSDSNILDNCHRWFNFGAYIIEKKITIETNRIVDLS